MTKLMFPGDGCVDKPLSTLWRNHISSEKADILMKVSQTPSMKQSDKRDNQIMQDKTKASEKLNLPYKGDCGGQWSPGSHEGARPHRVLG